MLKGIQEVDKNKKVTVIQQERAAIDHAIQRAEMDSFIVICSDVIPDALEQIMELKALEESGKLHLNA